MPRRQTGARAVSAAVLLSVAGALIGSFLATAAIRWPEGRSAASGRSRCDACGRTLAPWELVPLLSAALSHGRCRRCGARIDAMHVQVEAAGVAVGVVAGLASPDWPTALTGAGFGWTLLLLAALDWRALWLPDRVTVALAIGGLAAGTAGLTPDLADRLIGGAGGFGSLWLVSHLYARVRGREGMGAGDPKLFGAIGLWLGWRPLPATLTLAAMIGLAGAAALAAAGRPIAADRPLPFGTMLAAAAFTAWLVLIIWGA